MEQKDLDEAEEIHIFLGDEHQPAQVPGAVLVDTHCGHKGWMAPSTQQMIGSTTNNEVVLWCFHCGLKKLLETDTKPVNVPGQHAELAANLSPEDLDKAETIARALGFDPQ